MKAPPPLLTTDRLLLRFLTVADAPAFFRAIDSSRADLQRWIPWGLEASESVPVLETRLQREHDECLSGVAWRYGIFERSGSGELIGHGALFPRIGPGALEIGYWLVTSATGRGIATEAARALTEAAFEVDGIDRVEIRCAPDNERSIRVPERLGFRRAEGLVHVPARGERPPVDLEMWEAKRPGIRGA